MTMSLPRHLLPGTTHWHVGSNMPGYLPDSDEEAGYAHETLPDARACLAADLVAAADAIGTGADEHLCGNPCLTYRDPYDCPEAYARMLRDLAAELLASEDADWDGHDFSGRVWWLITCHEPYCTAEV